MVRLLLAVSVAALCACTGEAEWSYVEDGARAPLHEGPQQTHLGGWTAAKDGLPSGGVVRSLAYLDGTVFAVVDSLGATDVYSLPRGATAWSLASPQRFSSGEVFRALAVLDRTLYLTASDDAAQSGSLYALQFADDPWKRLDAAPALPLSAITRKGGRLLVAAHGATGAGLYGSSDDGATWTPVTTAQKAPFFSRPVRSFANSPAAQRLFATGEASSGFGGLFASDDNGATWQKLQFGGDVVDVRASAEFVLVATTLDGELRSDNYGSTFHPNALPAKATGFFLSGARAFAGTQAGVVVSDDGGQTWRDASEGLPSFTQVDCLYLAGSSLVAAGASGVFVAELSIN